MRQLLLIAVLIVVTFLLSSCASVYTEDRFIPSDYAGIVHAGRTGTEEEFAFLNYLGVKWVLHTFNWNMIEPEQGVWDFEYYDKIVDDNAAAGIKVLGVLAYDVKWIHENGKGKRHIPPAKTPEFLKYVQKTVEHFQGRIGAWCIWNEPNAHFWQGTDDEFVELTRQTADAVREIDSEVILLGGAFNRGVFGLPQKFIRKIFESGAMEKTDGIAFHPYELNPARSAILYDRFKKIVDDYGFGDKIWLTEAGYPTGGWYPTKVSEKRFPEYVIKTIVLLAARSSNKLLWYQMFDPIDREKRDSEDFFGLVRSKEDYASKGAHAFRLSASYLPGTTCYMQETGRGGIPRSIRMFWFKNDSGGALVLWNDGLGSKSILLQLPGINHKMHNFVTGNADQIQTEIFVKIGKSPLFITWQNAVLPEEN